MSIPSETRWHGAPAAAGASPSPPSPARPDDWTLGRLGYLLSLVPITFLVFVFRPEALPLLAPAILVVCVAPHARWVDVLWYASVVVAAIASAPRRVRDFGHYGLGAPGGCEPPLDSLQLLQREGPVFGSVESGGVYVFSFSALTLALMFGSTALIAPVVRYAVQRRRVRKRAERTAPPTEPTEF